jgi:predicted dinucleotide-binding enzyme
MVTNKYLIYNRYYRAIIIADVNQNQEDLTMNITIIGAGNVGQKLGGLIANAGHTVIFGAQNPEGVNLSINASVQNLKKAINASEVVFFAIPFTAYEDLLPSLEADLSGKIVVDVSNPLNDDWSPLNLGNNNSAGEMVAKLLPSSKVVKAFNTIFADIMTDAGLNRKGNKVTAFIAGNDEKAVDVIKAIASDIGTSPVIAGSIENARYFEAIAHLNIQLAVGQGGGTDAAFVYFQG